MMVAAALASLPPHMLDALMTRQGAASHNTSGRSGQTRAGSQRGRPLPPRPGRPGGQARLHVLATLRAAAPKQRLRQAAPLHVLPPSNTPSPSRGRVAIRAEDFHIQRYQQRASSCLILALDASGSAALQRLAEAKGAVELLLQQSYARRDSVCIVAFRGAQAFAHAGERQGPFGPSAGEGMARQVGRDHGEVLCQRWQEAAPAEVARAGAVQEQQAGALPPGLHMPVNATGLHKAAVLRMRPDGPVFGPGHAGVKAFKHLGVQAAPVRRLSMAWAMRWACTCGMGR